MARIERIEMRLVDIAAEGQAHRRHPELRLAGDADRDDHRQRRRGRDRLQLHDRHGRLLGHAPRSPTIWRRGSSARKRNGSRRSGASSNSPPTPPRSARFRRWRWRRSTPRCGTCAASGAACRCGSSPAARPTGGRSTRPKADGCTSTRTRSSTTRSPRARRVHGLEDQDRPAACLGGLPAACGGALGAGARL